MVPAPQMAARPQAFYDLDDFPRLRDLAASWQIARDEAAGLQAPIMDVDRTGQTYDDTLNAVLQQVQAGKPFGWVHGGNPGLGMAWVQFGMVMHGQQLPFAAPLLPRTMALFRDLQGIKVAALFRLAPHTVLPAHMHPHLREGDRLQAHITLTTPNQPNRAYLSVAGEFREHVPGAAFVFDGLQDHFAVNASSEERVILYLEFEKAALYRPRASAARQI